MALAPAALVPGDAAAEPVILDRVVAVVNDEIILDSELEEFVRTDEEVFQELNKLGPNPDEGRVEQIFQEMRPSSLDRLIGRRLVLGEGARLQVEATEQELSTYLGNVATNYGMGVDELKTAVERSGQFASWDEYQAKLREDIVIYKLEMSLAPYSVTEAQIRAEYTKMIGSEDAVVKVIRMRFRAEDSSSAADDRAFAAAKKAARRLKAGETPSKVAAEMGIDSEEHSYDRGKAAPVIRESLFDIRVSEAIGPLNTAQGYLVFKVLEIDETSVLPYDDAKEAIAQRLDAEARKKAERELHERLRAQAHVDIRL
jgi:peptidyl-prolyl cis-trans isomerase SurA